MAKLPRSHRACARTEVAPTEEVAPSQKLRLSTPNSVRRCFPGTVAAHDRFVGSRCVVSPSFAKIADSYLNLIAEAAAVRCNDVPEQVVLAEPARQELRVTNNAADPEVVAHLRELAAEREVEVKAHQRPAGQRSNGN